MLTDEACFEYVFKLRWPQGFRCPHCGYGRAYEIRTRNMPLFQCVSCRKQTSLTSGTIMEKSRTPLHKWVRAFQLVTYPPGVTAVELSRIIQVTYKTAWSMLRKIRQAISDASAKVPLRGTVEASVVFYGKRNFHPFLLHPKEFPALIGASVDAGGQINKLKIVPIDREWLESKHLLPYARGFARQALGSLSPVRVLRRSKLQDLFQIARKWYGRFNGVSKKYESSCWDEICFRLNTVTVDDLCRIAVGAG